MSDTTLIDCRGLACPMPLLKAKLGFSTLAPGGSLTLLADDPGADRDIPTWAARVGAACRVDHGDQLLTFTIGKPF
ncbi:sulfurtransferase TusA family protein [Litorivicinus lipolyticus]|uniref:sulfurtransferase TusA family protein n=1 Tax=Litorivicinus lipolyticus TaxID=418701 RepID=UPI003B597814